MEYESKDSVALLFVVFQWDIRGDRAHSAGKTGVRCKSVVMN